MATVKAESVHGNCKFAAVGEVTEEQLQILGNAGLLQVLQRSPATAAEKEQAGYDKRPEKFQRSSIDYNDKNAAILKKHLESAKLVVGKDDKGKDIEEPLVLEVTVEQYFPGEGSVPKFADERAKYAQRGGEGKLEALASAVSYTGDLGDGTADNAPVEFLRAIKAFKDAQMKAAMAGV